jgi:hypothetical protein
LKRSGKKPTPYYEANYTKLDKKQKGLSISLLSPFIRMVGDAGFEPVAPRQENVPDPVKKNNKTSR